MLRAAARKHYVHISYQQHVSTGLNSICMPVNAHSRHNSRNFHHDQTVACHALGLGQQLCSRIRDSLGASVMWGGARRV